jgi:Fic family protein
MASDTGWPRFETETLEWTSAFADYGPRAGRAAHSGPYQAAVPPAIAQATLVLDSETAALVAEASTEITRLDGEMSTDPGLLAALLLRTEAASSSQIEHLTSSAKAIGLAELGRHDRANATEIAANVAAMEHATAATGTISPDSIRAIHRELMAEPLGDGAGKWREEPVWVGGSARSPHGADYVAPRADLIPTAVKDLTAFAKRDDIAPLALAALFHAQFESLHPFIDGNGRTGRALLHVQLRLAGLTRRSLVPISAGLLSDTDRYFAAITTYQQGDPKPIIIRVAEAVFPALANTRQLLTQVRTVRAEWNTQIQARSDAAAWRLADLVMTRPVVDAGLVAQRLNVTEANAQVAINRLVKAGVLRQIGNGSRNRAWEAPEILDAMDAFAARAHRRLP